MADAMRKQTICYERDESGWWVAKAKGIRGCHTQGRTIVQARRRIREALELFVDELELEKMELVDDIKLPASVRSSLSRLHATRKRADEEAGKLAECTTEVVKVLIEDVGLSMREVAELVGLSHQRVHQLISSVER